MKKTKYKKNKKAATTLDGFIEQLISLKKEHPEYGKMPVVCVDNEYGYYWSPNPTVEDTGNDPGADSGYNYVRDSEINLKYNQNILVL